MTKNYDFYMKTNIDPYIGQWVAICNQKIVSHGKNAKTVFNKAKKLHPSEKPFLARIPDKEAIYNQQHFYTT